MINYEKGQIYKIVNDVNDERYVGSTCKGLARRMAQHRKDVRSNKTPKLHETMRTIGIPCFRIVLVEDHSCK